MTQRRKDAVQFVGYFPEPADVRADFASALAARYLRWGFVAGVIGERRPPASVAAALEKLAVHVKNVARSRLFVEVVDVLGAEEQAVRQPLLQIGEREMRGIGLGGGRDAPAHGVEVPDQCGILCPGIRGCDLFDAIIAPQATHPAKGGDATLGTDT